MGLFSGSKTFKSLENRDFRLFFFAQMFSLMGTGMQATAQSWLLWKMTGSETLLGILGFAQMGPVLVFGICGGLIADRLPRKRLVISTQALALVQAGLMTFLAYSGMITPTYIILLAGFLGIINAFDMTARQTFLGDMVGMKDVGNAIALNSVLFNTARIVAPPIAGVIVSSYGEGLCFALNAVSFLLVLAALIMIRARGEAAKNSSSVISSLREAVDFIRGDAASFRLLLLLVVTSLMLLPYGYFLPYFADTVLGGKARMFGFLISSVGSGALTGALIVARNRKVSRMPMLMGLFSFLLGVDMLLFSFSKTPFISIPLLFFGGLCTMFIASSSNIFLQTSAPEHLRGRVVSFYVTAFVGIPPLGGFFMGSFAENYGTPAVLMWCAIITSAVSAFYLFTLKKPADQPPGL